MKNQEIRIKQLEKEIKKLKKSQKKPKNLLEELSEDKEIKELVKFGAVVASIVLPIKLIHSIGE